MDHLGFYVSTHVYSGASKHGSTPAYGRLNVWIVRVEKSRSLKKDPSCGKLIKNHLVLNPQGNRTPVEDLMRKPEVSKQFATLEEAQILLVLQNVDRVLVPLYT